MTSLNCRLFIHTVRWVKAQNTVQILRITTYNTLIITFRITLRRIICMTAIRVMLQLWLGSNNDGSMTPLCWYKILSSAISALTLTLSTLSLSQSLSQTHTHTNTQHVKTNTTGGSLPAVCSFPLCLFLTSLLPLLLRFSSASSISIPFLCWSCPFLSTSSSPHFSPSTVFFQLPVSPPPPSLSLIPHAILLLQTAVITQG